MNIEPIGRINCDFKEKFGIPRQSGLANTKAEIVFLPEYSSPDAFRGLEGYSHIWLLWGFDRIEKEGISLTVRPPRLGGNIRMGVFATRSPFRPNHIGLSLVELEDIANDRERGTVLKISGADLCDGTPIYDIKPYLPSIECKPEARGGFAKEKEGYSLSGEIPQEICEKLQKQKVRELKEILSGDPRPSYHDNPERIYKMTYGNLEVSFRVEKSALWVVDICEKLG